MPITVKNFYQFITVIRLILERQRDGNIRIKHNSLEKYKKEVALNWTCSKYGETLTSDNNQEQKKK